MGEATENQWQHAERFGPALPRHVHQPEKDLPKAGHFLLAVPSGSYIRIGSNCFSTRGHPQRCRFHKLSPLATPPSAVTSHAGGFRRLRCPPHSLTTGLLRSYMLNWPVILPYQNIFVDVERETSLVAGGGIFQFDF